jgi:VanZ family protein
LDVIESTVPVYGAIMSKPVRLLALWGPPLVLMAVIFAFSAMPSDTDKHVWWVFALRKVAHFSEYALLCGLLIRALRGRLLTAWVLTVGYAITDELHQTLVDGRVGTWHDVIIDAAGALVAVLLVRRYSQPRSVASSTA